MQSIHMASTQTPPAIRTSPFLMVLSLLLADAGALMAAVSLSVTAKAAFTTGFAIDNYLRLWPFLFVFIAVYWTLGLYSGVLFNPAEELRRVTLASVPLFLALAAITVSIRGATSYFSWALFLTIATSLFLIPLLRATVRHILGKKIWWGYPAVIMGSAASTRIIINAIRRDPGIGLKPVAVCSGQDLYRGTKVDGIPVLSMSELSSVMPRARGAYAVLATSDIPPVRLFQTVHDLTPYVSRVLMIPDLSGTCSLMANPKSVGGMLGLELPNLVASNRSQVEKRVLDIFLTIIAGLFLLPLIALIACAVRLESRGPIFYSQRRIGRGGRMFCAWKFRSMAINADEVLAQYLQRDHILRAEWELNHKLRNDPRITRVGRFLRQTSLDELPQLWNVLRGDMSLVGPRPIVQAEVKKYGECFDLYTRVLGGVTGLWQVSGRNNVSYEERVLLDAFYVRNWSVWLDFCILFRTIAVVLFRKGAY